MGLSWKIVLKIVSAGFALLLTVSVSAPAEAAERPAWTEHRLIAHAMGGISGKDYTNSYEAFLVNYEKGHRIFEVDLILSEDEKLVARHDWLEYSAAFLGQNLPEDKIGVPLTVKEFKSAKIMDKYKPLTFLDVLKLLRDYPDITIITDTKETDSVLIRKQFQDMVRTASGMDVAYLKRIVPEIYTPEMYDIVKGIYDFPSVIYSIYQSADTPEEIVRYAAEKNIAVVAMPIERAAEPFISALRDKGIVTYVHTTNSFDELQEMDAIGVHGFYSDFLSNRSLRMLNMETDSRPMSQSEQASSAGSNRTFNPLLLLVLMQTVFVSVLVKYRSGQLRR